MKNPIAKITFEIADSAKPGLIKTIRGALAIGLLEARNAVEGGLLVDTRYAGSIIQAITTQAQSGGFESMSMSNLAALKISISIIENSPLPFYLPLNDANNIHNKMNADANPSRGIDNHWLP